MTGSLQILPDPDHPGGGYARLHFPEGAVPDSTVELTVYDLFREKYLGLHHWQPVPAQFGPYPVTPDGQGGSVAVIGPEIVNEIAEFARVRFDTGGFQADVAWPDTIWPDPGAPTRGTIRVAGQSNPNTQLRGTGRDRQGHDDPTTPPKTTPPGTPVTTGPDDTAPVGTLPQPSRRRGSWILAAVALAALIGAGAWYLNRPPAPVIVPRPVPVPPPIPVPAAACSLETLDTAGGDLSARLDGVAGLLDNGVCQGQAASDLALRLIEREAGAQNPQALLLFGQIYDPGVVAPVAQDRLGVSLAEDVPIALDYYVRAREAGAEAAEAALRDLCARSTDAADPLVAATREELCP